VPRKDNSPISIRIRLRYPDIDTFIEKYAANISQGGMFIQSRAPQPVGTTLRFEVLLEDGERLLRGEGKVIWIREYDAAYPTRVHGMGVKFLALDDESYAVVNLVLAHKTRSPESRKKSATQQVRALEREAQTEDEAPQEEQEEQASRVVAAEPEPAPEPAPAPPPPTATPLPAVPPSALALPLDAGGDGVAAVLTAAQQKLDEILADAGLSEAQVATSLSRVLAGPADGPELAELDDLLASEPLPPADPSEAMAILHRSLGAEPVQPVPHTTWAPIKRAPARPSRPAPAPPVPEPEPEPELALPVDATAEPEPEPAIPVDATAEPEPEPEPEFALPVDATAEPEPEFAIPVDATAEPEPEPEPEFAIPVDATPEPEPEPDLDLPITAETEYAEHPEHEAPGVETFSDFSEEVQDLGELDQPSPTFDPALLEAAVHVSRATQADRSDQSFDLSEAPQEAAGEEVFAARRMPEEAPPEEPPEAGWKDLRTVTELLDHDSSHVLQDMAAQTARPSAGPPTLDEAEEAATVPRLEEEASPVANELSSDMWREVMQDAADVSAPGAAVEAPVTLDDPMAGLSTLGTSEVDEEMIEEDLEFFGDDEENTQVSGAPAFEVPEEREGDLLPSDNIFPSDPDLNSEVFETLSQPSVSVPSQSPAPEMDGDLTFDVDDGDSEVESSDSIPSLEHLAGAAHAGAPPPPPPAAPADVADLRVLAEDPDQTIAEEPEPEPQEGGDIRPRKSGIFRRLFGKKKE
jgi:uncharacterized protein (TIGR02266 family)